jgi:two-component system OmpR family response regulator
MSDKRLQAAMHGTVTVYEGSRSYHTASRADRTSFVESPHRLRVVIVEDSAIIRARLTETLGEIPDVDVVDQIETQTAALNRLREPNWDAVVLDLQLKEGTGLGVLKALGDDRPPGTKVIVFTNYASPVYRERSLKLGADYVFDKVREFHRVREVLAEMAVDGMSGSR